MCSRRLGAELGHEAGTATQEAAGREAHGDGATHLHSVVDLREEEEPLGVVKASHESQSSSNRAVEAARSSQPVLGAAISPI